MRIAVTNARASCPSCPKRPPPEERPPPARSDDVIKSAACNEPAACMPSPPPPRNGVRLSPPRNGLAVGGWRIGRERVRVPRECDGQRLVVRERQGTESEQTRKMHRNGRVRRIGRTEEMHTKSKKHRKPKSAEGRVAYGVRKLGQWEDVCVRLV